MLSEVGDEDFVIGILGGSVAGNLLWNIPSATPVILNR